MNKITFIKYFVSFIWVLIVVIFPFHVRAVDYRQPEVRIFEMQQRGRQEVLQGTFAAFESEYEAGGTIAVGDVNGDGQQEIIIGAGAGVVPQIKVFSITGVQLNEFIALPEHIKVGLNIATGDLDKNGTDEIVVGAGKGGGPFVQIFDMYGNKKFTSGFFAFAENFRGGVNVAVGNVDGKGKLEIIVGAGGGGGAHVRVFNYKGEYTGMDFFPFAADEHGGVSVATANVDGGMEDEIVMAIASFGQSWVKVYKSDTQQTILGEFLAYDPSFRGGVNVAGADVDKDGREEVVTSTRQAGAAHVRVFEGHGAILNSGFLAYEDDFRGGVAIAAANIDNDSKYEILTMPMKKIIEGRVDLFKYIEVDISEQTLRAYRNGIKENEFLVSTGIDKYPTPLGETKISAKIPLKDYEWTYGHNHPDNYDLPDVEYNLRFRPTYYIHYAYWHNNFGRKMSHGCVNVNAVNSEWVYNWADVDITVVIKE